jgi:hypothetical protein
MKHACLVIAALLVTFGCGRSERAKQEGATSSATATADVTATVTFAGLITHVLGSHQRAVIVYAADHPREITISGISDDGKKIVQEKLGGECPGACSFKLNYMSLQLLDGKGKTLTGNLTSHDGTFTSLVPNLYDLDKTAFDDTNIAPEVIGDVKYGSQISWGYFDLHGADASTSALPCRGRFNQTGSFMEFPAKTTMKFALAGGGTLRVGAAKADGMTDTYDIALVGSNVGIDVNNNIQSGKSHFHEYRKLSTAPQINLPPVQLEEQTAACKAAIGPFGGVPGCTCTKIAIGGTI